MYSSRILKILFSSKCRNITFSCLFDAIFMKCFSRVFPHCGMVMWVSDFTFTEDSRSKAIFSISLNYVSLQFYIMKSGSRLIPIVLALSLAITQKTKINHNNRSNCHSRISQFTHMLKIEITFTLHSRKFYSQPITTCFHVKLFYNLHEWGFPNEIDLQHCCWTMRLFSRSWQPHCCLLSHPICLRSHFQNPWNHVELHYFQIQ